MARFPFLSSPSTSILLFIAAVALFYGFFYDHGGGGDCEGGRGQESVSREVFPMEGDVVWVVQITDLHLCAYHPERGEDLKSTLSSALRVIRPSLVLITGDITDAKNRERTSTRQDESEWIQYKNIMDVVIRESEVEKHRFFDIRGNHDKYGVPFVTDKLDFFSTYSISSQMNRVGTIQSITLVGVDRRYMFLGIDDTMNIGIRGPSNLFGHPTDERMKAVNAELQHWDSNPQMVTKVVFGHFPLSFTSSSGSGKRYETIFAKQSISAYICGHLHAKLGRQLWKKHMSNSATAEYPEEVQQFWEWELGDWKETRVLRVLAIDRGKVSFLDIDFPCVPKQQEDFETAILVTHPLDSRSMSHVDSKYQLSRDDITALVFSAKPIVNVIAQVYDSSKSLELIEEVPLRLSNSSASHGKLFTSKWNMAKYRSACAACYSLQVFVLDTSGRETASTRRPFSLDDEPAETQVPWATYVIFHIRWENLHLILFWISIAFLVMLLFLPKIVNYFVEKDALYQRWAVSVSISLPIQQKRTSFWVLWFLLEGSRNKRLWYCMVFYIFYLLRFPWFMGYATSENGELAKMFMFGWTVDSYNCSNKDMLGFPDVMVVTMPFMYLVVSPLFLLIYSLLAESSSFYLHNNKKSGCIKEHLSSKRESKEIYHRVDGVLFKSSKGMKSFLCKMCKRWMRTAILSGCVLVSCIHVKQILALMRAYGKVPIVLSPPFCWAPPLLTAAAIYSTT